MANDYQSVLSVLRSIKKKYIKICADMDYSESVKAEVKEDLEYCMDFCASDIPITIKVEAYDTSSHIMKCVGFLSDCKSLGW